MISELFGLQGFASTVRNTLSLENPNLSLNDPKSWKGITGSLESASGVVIDHDSALTFDPVWQALSIISGDVASLPIHVYKRLADDDREIDTAHDAEWLIAEQANDDMTAYCFWRALMVHALLWGNGYAMIERKNGKAVGLLPLLPDRTAPEKLTKQTILAANPGNEAMAAAMEGMLVYVTEAGGKLKTILPQDIIHIKGLSRDGMVGYDLVSKARDSWGLGLASIKFASQFFANGGRVGGILELPSGMPKPVKDDIEEGFRKMYEKDAFKTVILRDNAKFHAAQQSPQDSQMVESRNEDRLAVASWFNLPPHKLGIAGSVSYNSHEQGEIAYLTGCLRHWLYGIKVECQAKLLTEQQRRKRTHYMDHVVEKLLQTDIKTTNEVLAIQRQNEIINADEWRRVINRNKRADGGGGEYANPNVKSIASPQSDPPPNDATKNAARANLRDAVSRLSRRIGAQARKAAKSSEKFMGYVDATCRPWAEDASEVLAAPGAVVDAIFDLPPAATFDALLKIIAAAELRRLKPLLDPPHTADQLEANTDRAMKAFESEAADLISQLEKHDG